MNALLSIGLSGLRTYLQKLRNTAHNIANVNTSGFKAGRLESKEAAAQQPAAGKPGIQRGSGVQAAGTTRSTAHGALNQTNNPLDLAIDGSGFFQLTQPDGTTAFTRSGSFHRSADGQLVSADGLPLNPPIVIPQDAASIPIFRDGNVLAEIPGQPQPQNLGQIRLAGFQNPGGLKAIGKNQYAETAASGSPIIGQPGQAGFGSIVQGFLEMSNVDIVDTQVNLITQQHAFQANAQSIRTGDENLGTVINLKK